MQGDNGSIKEVLQIASFTDYLVIYMIYHCVVFCLYSEMALYNNEHDNGQKERPHINPRFMRVDLEAKVEIGNQVTHPVIDLSVGIGIEIEGITITGIIIGPIIGIDPGTTLGITLKK